MYKKLEIFTDGGARGNPGPAGIGVVVWHGTKLVGAYNQYIGQATNNVAEYRAVIHGLEQARHLGASELTFYLDSELVVNQLERRFKVKDRALGVLFVQAWNLIIGFRKVSFHHVPREKNRDADRQVNVAIDRHLNS